MPGSNEDRILEALDAIQGELRQRQMTLVHKPDCIVLAVRDTRGPYTFKALAQVAFITPGEIRWRPVGDANVLYGPGNTEPWRGKP